MLKDWRGNEIKVGSVIIYPGRSGSSLWVSEAEVVEIATRVHPYRSGQSEPILKVRKIRWSGYGSSRPDSGKSTLTRIHRVTVIG